MTEALFTGAEALVTTCPWCNDNLTSAKGEDGKSMEVTDLLELVAAAL